MTVICFGNPAALYRVAVDIALASVAEDEGPLRMIGVGDGNRI